MLLPHASYKQGISFQSSHKVRGLRQASSRGHFAGRLTTVTVHYLGQRRPPHRRTRMPNARTFTGSAEINAMVARVAPAVLELLADGTPRSKAAIVEALAGRYDRQDVISTLIRLSVTGEVEETDGRYTLPAEP